MKRFRIEGAPAALAAALDQLHVRAEVLGVVELSGALDICVKGGLPALADVVVTPLAIEAEPMTGRENDTAFAVGEAILVRPPWVPAPAGFAGVELVVPRGMAFGSGEHGSTRAALTLMERMWTPRCKSAFDVGTGSGILLLYAQARGATALYGCDIEEASVTAAAALVSAATIVLGGPATGVMRDVQADLVVANMRIDETLDCLADIQARWNGAGPLLLSGVQEPDVEELRRAVGAPVFDHAADGGYVALGFVK